MFNISESGIVTVNRGDSFKFPITIQVGDILTPKRYELQPGDVLYLGIMEPNQPFEVAIVRKKLTYEESVKQGSISFRFWPEDTSCLLPGKYYYQVKIETLDQETNRLDVETVIEKTLFYIQE